VRKEKEEKRFDIINNALKVLDKEYLKL